MIVNCDFLECEKFITVNQLVSVILYEAVDDRQLGGGEGEAGKEGRGWRGASPDVCPGRQIPLLRHCTKQQDKTDYVVLKTAAWKTKRLNLLGGVYKGYNPARMSHPLPF